jgi:hypothetical protein
VKHALVILGLLAGVAGAAPVTPPKQWTPDASSAVSLSQTLGNVPHFGGVRSVVTAEVYRAPSGGALFVTRVAANVTAAQRDAAATAELDELRATLRRQGAGAKPESWAQRAHPDTKLLEAALAWRDVTAGLAMSSRAVIAGDGQQLVAVSGECVLAADAPAEITSACLAALATLDPGIAPAGRVALAIAGESATAGAEAGGPQAISETAMPRPSDRMADSPSMQAPLLDDGKRPALPPITIPPERSTDRRPIYVGGGLVVLALLFWWNRKQRERFDREDEGPKQGDKQGEKTKPASAEGDADADDLHAAARGGDDDTNEGKQS